MATLQYDHIEALVYKLSTIQYAAGTNVIDR